MISKVGDVDGRQVWVLEQASGGLLFLVSLYQLCFHALQYMSSALSWAMTHFTKSASYHLTWSSTFKVQMMGFVIVNYLFFFQGSHDVLFCSWTTPAVHFWPQKNLHPRFKLILMYWTFQRKFCSLQTIYISGVPCIDPAFGVQHARSGSHWQWPGAPPWLSSLLSCPLSFGH